MEKKYSIAIDGPASAGKSTIAKILAEKLNYIYCDTGAMYRVLTYAALQQQVDLSDGSALAKLFQEITISFHQGQEGQHVFLNGSDVTDVIRQKEVSGNVSEVSIHQEVRAKLVAEQKKIANAGGIVMDGRDIGTVVLPKAEVKIFLVASVEERAKRRHEENLAKGLSSEYNMVKEEIEKRDYLDSHRENSPLIQANDAVLVDTTGRSITEVVQYIIDLVEKERLQKKG